MSIDSQHFKSIPATVNNDTGTATLPIKPTATTDITSSDINTTPTPMPSSDNSTGNEAESSFILNQLLIDDSLHWQVHNCKISQKLVSQTQPMPFLYHYDTLSDDLKAANPLTADLLAKFNIPMLPAEANLLLSLPNNTIPTPWQVKIIGTLVLFCEQLQIALRLKFTNTAKQMQPIYTTQQSNAVQQACQQWHLFDDLFVLNKSTKIIKVLATDAYLSLPKAEDYQRISGSAALIVFEEIETQPKLKEMMNTAIQQRIE
ncbi:hypothetical protein [Psychrobacter sp. I-STPA10]|uniref:hypothetical protein n=1 Tax=Psychrobacter sp. I-STPA10 TaxID=2585769 RepID=UPI001E2A1BCA|nr:hypothetical protein [Psychrobacter sp. I-STPA10]